MHTKSALAASIGGALEWYDFIIYGFFAEVLGRQFFPENDAYSQHLLIFGVFAVGYIARSAGGLFFGHIGDKYGRRKSLSITMFLGGLATVCMALMPSYASIGVTASLLFVLARLVQGLTVGANTSGAIVYISELTSKKRRGFWIGAVFLGIQRGVMLASVVSAVLLSYLSNKELQTWGWRVAFLIGLIVMGLALYSKEHLIETPHHLELRQKNKVSDSPVKLLLKQYKLATLFGIGLTTIFSISLTFMLLYMPTFLRYYGFLPHEIIHATFYNLFVFSMILPLFGWISDYLGPRKLLAISALILIITIYPCTGLILQRKVFLHYLGLTLLSANLAAIATTIPVLLVGIFPTVVRFTGVSFAYNICQSFFTAILPLLFAVSGHYISSERIAVAVFFSGGAIISLLTLFYVRPQDDWLYRKELIWEQQNEYSN